MRSPIVKRSIIVRGHKTSVSLEDAFWRGLKEIAQGQCVTLSRLVATIDLARKQSNLSSAIRVFVLERTRAMTFSAESLDGSKAGTLFHGNIEAQV